MVFALSAVAVSIAAVFLIRTDVVSMGASGGIAGLACGYFLDHGRLRDKEFAHAVFSVLFIVVIFSLYDNDGTGVYALNWILHSIGAITAGIYITARPIIVPR